MGDVIDLNPGGITARDVLEAATADADQYTDILIIAVKADGTLARWSNTNAREFHAFAAAAAQDVAIKAMNGELVFE